MEIDICEFYDWNISFVTFYDHLREYLHEGVILPDDEILIKEAEVIERITRSGSQASITESEMEPINEPEDGLVDKKGQSWVSMTEEVTVKYSDMTRDQKDDIQARIRSHAKNLLENIL